jgi:hypothetical protein
MAFTKFATEDMIKIMMMVSKLKKSSMVQKFIARSFANNTIMLQKDF